MAIDGFFIRNLVNEVKNDILNSRLERITNPSNDFFVMSFYYQGRRRFLNFKLKPPTSSFFITSKIINTNSDSSNFLNSLKKHLEGYIIKDIKQHLNDRVVIFEFEGVDLIKGLITKNLVLELMGRYNNLILLINNLIIDSYIKNVSTTNRSIVNNIEYQFFPSDKKNFELSDFKNIISPVYLSENFIGISPLLSNYLYNNKVDIFNIEVKPTINLTTNQFYWFDLFNLEDNKVYYNTISEMLFSKIEVGTVSKEKYDNFINKNLNMYQNRLIKLKERLIQYEDDLNLSNYGNYIYSSGLNLDEKHSEFKSYDGEIVKLDVTKTLNENAKDFYKRYQKAKRGISHLNDQIIENERLVVLFKEFLYDLENIKSDFKDLELALKPFGFKTKTKVVKKNKQNYLTINYLNNTYYVGRNSRENEIVTHELSSKNDYWFHIKNSPGSHVLMKGELSNETLEFGSMLAARYSKERDNPIVTINYTQVKYLKKIPKMPLSQVILTKYQSINIKVNNDLINSILSANNLK